MVRKPDFRDRVTKVIVFSDILMDNFLREKHNFSGILIRFEFPDRMNVRHLNRDYLHDWTTP